MTLISRFFNFYRSNKLILWIAVALAIVLFVIVISGVPEPKKPAINSPTPDPLLLKKPFITPSAIPPSSELARVVVGTTIVGTSKPPQVLLLEKVKKNGDYISTEAELRDDGKDPDAKPGDGFYAGVLRLGSEEEDEIYFRLRAEYFGETVISEITVFPITRVRLDFRLSKSPLVDSADGRDKLYTNEVIIGTPVGVSPRRVQTIVVEVGNTLGQNPEDIRVEGYIPSINAYLVEFKGDGTLQGVNKATSAFKAYSEIKSASPNFKGRLASQWFLESIRVDDTNPGIDDLRERAGSPEDPTMISNPSRPPMYGWPSIGVAVIDNGVDCSNSVLSRSDSSSKCADPAPALLAICSGIYAPGAPDTWHGSKVAALVAGQGDASNDIQGVEGGVAWNTRLFPFLVDNSRWQLHTSIDCARHANNLAHSQIIHILNISRAEFSPDEDLRSSVCNAVCDNMLIVASAGNHSCILGDIAAYPAKYNVDPDDCDCFADVSDDITLGNRILDVGGSDTDNVKATCSASGEIYAPGWGIGSDEGFGPNGTSWSAALVSGCAAVRGAIQEWKGVDWDATLIEKRLRDTATPGTPLLDCWAAVSDRYDISFVLDRSGSMSLPTDTHPTRWNALTDAVNGFMLLINETALQESHFGLTLFASEVLTPNDLAFSSLVGINADLSDKVALELISHNGNVRGSTAMGAGLQTGMAKMMDASRPRVVVLFTDGDQNEDPRVDNGGCTYSNPTIEYPATLVNPDCLNDPESNFVKIITVGILQPDSGYLSTLQALAHNNRGTSIITSDGATFSGDGLTVDMDTLQNAFALAIAPALADNSPQVVASYKGTLSNTVTLPAFDVNKYVSQLLIKLSLTQKFKRPELASILDGVRIMKDGTDIMGYFQQVFPDDETNSVLLKANFVYRGKGGASTIAPEGSYTIHMAEPANLDEELGYRVVAYADDHLLDMEWQVTPLAPSVNQPFIPTIRLNWRGKPITNAHVEARILEPGGIMGDMLAKHPLKVKPSRAPDAGSPGHQKYLHLVENDPKFLAQLRPHEESLILTHQGDGQYSAPYNPGDVSGIYQILYRVTAEDTEFSKIQRQVVQSIYTRFGDIDLNQSAVTSTVKANTVTINFRPITTNGHFIGPAQDSAFSVEGAGISLNSITDLQDGSYTLILAGDPDSQVSIKLLGEEIYQGPASEIGKKGLFKRLLVRLESLGLPAWLIWFIVTALLLLILLARRLIVGANSR